MAEYIDRIELLNKIEAAQNSLMSDNDAMWEMNQKYYKGLAWAHRIIDDSPVVVAPVVSARWAHLSGDEWCCTHCGEVIHTEGSWEKPDKKFCYECGAKMDQEA